MYVSHLSVRDFRSYPAAAIDLQPGVTTFLGRNGAGKTNLVEALGYVATLGSHRVAGDAPLVRNGQTSAVLRLSVVHLGREARVEIEIAQGRANRARVNRAPVSRVRDVLGILRTVLFAPEDLALVKGDPGERRRFLDDLLVTRVPRWAGVRADYDRVLKQRTALLKSVAGLPRSARSELPTLDAWDGSLARLGAELIAGRLALIDELRPRVAQAYAVLALVEAPADGEGLPACDVQYRTSVNTGEAGMDQQEWEKALSLALIESRSSEIDRGVCLVGPHRDELLLTLGREGLPARGYASHGESWSFALALRLAAYELLRDEGAEPVLVLDDVFAELDAGRRERLADLLVAAEQVLITAADVAYVPEALRGRCVNVPEGVVTEQAADEPGDSA